MSKIIGIDLRTSEACAAVWEDGRVHIIPPREEDRTVGLFSHASRPQMADVQMLRQFKADAEAYLNQTVDSAVITVPASFNMAQREALLRTCQVVGLNVRRLLNEPTAAAIVYSGVKEEEQLLVCSLSGDTLSVSAISLEDGIVEVLTCAWASLTEGIDRTQAAEETVRRAMKDIDPNRLSSALLVGDAVHNSALCDTVRRCVGKEPVLAPNRCVAIGAAMQGGIINGSLRNLLVLDIITPDVGIETREGEIVPLFSAATLPAMEIKTFLADSNAEMRLFQEGQMVKRILLRDIVPAGWNDSQVKLTFFADLNGIVEASVQDPAADKRADPPKPAAPPPPSTPPPPRPTPPPPPAAPAGAPSTVEVIRAFLPVYDNLERAMRQDTTDSAYKRGVEMTMDQLKGVLAKLGVTEIEALGKPFDPNFHDAVMHIEDGSFGKNIVSQVFQAGFMMGDKVIRFAVVQVAN